MKNISRGFILLLALSFLFGRLCAPMPAMAADKISKTEPQFISTPEEDIAKLGLKKEKTKSSTWLAVLVGVVALAALAGGGGGGGGGGSSTTNTDGSVSVGW